MAKLELEDIQGLLIRAYSNLPHAAYLLLRVSDAVRAKRWLESIVQAITPGDVSKPRNATNLALTKSGLAAFGINDRLMSMFAPEFQDTMSAKRRSKVLGDIGEDAPENWRWGSGDRSVDAVLMLYASSESALTEMITIHKNGLSDACEVIDTLHTMLHREGKEHFGFMDGISQPTIEGLNRDDDPNNTIRAGEFILGYPNQYDKYPDSILLKPANDPTNLLNICEDRKTHKDFGRNGSYLVFRHITQDPKEFWQSLAQEAATESDGLDMVALGSKIVGRRPDGLPLAVLNADQTVSHSATAPTADKMFQYFEADPHGEKCPVGSHIRRTNPRDSLVPGPKDSLIVANRHRILRRGRSYGAPVVESMDPHDILEAPKDTVDRGLHFICFNTNIGRQFEFVQQTWINNRKFAGLYSDADPALGECPPDSASSTDSTFTIPGTPLRRRIHCLPKFTHVVGGAYFFMPGIKALKYLASDIPPDAKTFD